MDERHDTIFEEEENTTPSTQEQPAAVDFDLLESQGKWLVKVVSGPNSGAEFALFPSASYLVGTDTTSCDIVFSDLSVSRQHAKITVDPEEKVIVEDLGSKNGVFVDHEKIVGNKNISANAVITLGTTTFMLIDRKAEHHTIVSPAFSKKIEEPKSEKSKEVSGIETIQQAALPPTQIEIERARDAQGKEARHAHAVSSFVVLAIITGLFVVAGIGTTMLFKTEELPQEKNNEVETKIQKILLDFPAVRYSYNPANGKILLVGHVAAFVDRSKLLDSLQQLNFVTGIDYSNVVIDEYVWREINQVLAKNPAWKSIIINSPAPGKFIMSGSLRTRRQADELNDYISQNFPYLDLLERHVVVEEELRALVTQKLIEHDFRNVELKINDGELQLFGTVGTGQFDKFSQLVAELRQTPGIRGVSSFVTEAATAQPMINISNRYQVTGYSSHGKNISVIVNGKIVTKNDTIDGMTIVEIQPSTIILEKDNFKYRIDFNR